MTRRTFGQVVGMLLISLGLRAEVNGNSCPRCGSAAHYVCPNRACSCWRDVGAGELPLRNRPENEDVLVCSYCGFAAHIDFWFDRGMAKFAETADESKAGV